MPKARFAVLILLCLASAILPGPAGAASGDTRVSIGSPSGPFAQNKQNEPAVAVDPNHSNILAAGSNDEIDIEACNAGDPTTCPFTAGVGTSGIYFSLDGGGSWTQPTYTGYSARDCLGPDPCQPEVGPIGTLPWYYENGLVSDGDPAVAFGPSPTGNGDFSWSAGSRLYYANLTSNFSGKRRDSSFKGVEGIGVSRTDDVVQAASGGQAGKDAWDSPVVIPGSGSSAGFADKEQIWADNAESSSFFGNVYVCFAMYRGGPSAGSNAHTLNVASSSNGGDTWSNHIVVKIPGSSSGKFSLFSGHSGCTVRTASDGSLYVFWLGWNQQLTQQGIYMARSFDGGATFDQPRRLFLAVHTGLFDPALGRTVEDGIAGARSDLSNAPSIDISNGAPTGADATDEIVLTWADGHDGLNDEHVFFTSSTDGGDTWASVARVEEQIGHPDDRGFYTAASISPDGTDVYLVYNSWIEPYKPSTIGAENDRPLVGVVAHADVGGDGTVGFFSQLHRSPPGDARGSSQNDLTAEFLGDYVYAAATRSYGTAVWNDVRDAPDCPAIDDWRMSLRGGSSAPQPAPNDDCPIAFGNSDIFGGTFADPTP